MKRSIVFIIATLLFGAVASAQSQKVIEKDFEKFSTVKVEDKFSVRLVSSDKYAVRINVDDRIAAHVQAYEKNGTLYLILDEKGYTKELKKQLKQKGAIEPTVEVEVYMPEIKSLILTDKAYLVHSDAIMSENFTLTASDNAKIKHLNITCATADIDLSKNVEFAAEMKVSSKLYLTAKNSVKASLWQSGGNTMLDLSNSAYVDMKAEVQTIEINVSSGAESHVAGTASMLMVNATGLSRTDTELLDTKDAEIVMNSSSKCHVNVTDKIKVNLTGGAMLTFKRNPMIEVDRILNSSLLKADDPRRK